MLGIATKSFSKTNTNAFIHCPSYLWLHWYYILSKTIYNYTKPIQYQHEKSPFLRFPSLRILDLRDNGLIHYYPGWHWFWWFWRPFLNEWMEKYSPKYGICPFLFCDNVALSLFLHHLLLCRVHPLGEARHGFEVSLFSSIWNSGMSGIIWK